jgi:hypothetical protein
MSLADHIADHESHGCRRVDRSLGFARMPEGYALMLDADGTYFYWLSEDGRESAEHWSKWAIWRWAKSAAKREVVDA